jgi:uncharacterized repeat protein (TIGR04138 family)
LDERSPEERLEDLLELDPRYPREAYTFVFEALDHTVRRKHGIGPDDPIPPSEDHHVTGGDLLDGVHPWGLTASEDIGEIVFNLVEHGLMGRRESDHREDFDHGYGGKSFAQVFAVDPQLEYCPERDEWTASYRSAASG